MNSVKLPDKAAKKLTAIKKKYKVAFEPLRIGNHELKLLKITDLEPLLKGKDPFKNVSDFPFWVKLWEASMVLAQMLTTTPPKPDQTLLELGAGLGAPGLAAAACGHTVTLSDYEPHILDFQRISAAASNLTNIDYKVIDWLDPPDLPQFDTIVGAEILFREDFFTPLLNVFRKLLTPGGTIYLAHDARRKSLPKFLKAAEKEYKIAVSARKMASDDGELVIIVNRLTHRETNSMH